jgi:hypothetical protein
MEEEKDGKERISMVGKMEDDGREMQKAGCAD